MAKAVKVTKRDDKKFLVAMDKVGSWYPITINGYLIVNRATEALAKDTASKIMQISKEGHIQVHLSEEDGMYEAWLTEGQGVDSKRHLRIESYFTRYYCERFSRKIATALGVPCISYLPVWDFVEEARKKELSRLARKKAK
jgi:hypothetical protein